MRNNEVIEIVREYLEQNGFDGLCEVDCECACTIKELAPCGQIGMYCRAGYEEPCDCGDHDFHINPAYPKQRRKDNER